MKQKQKPKRGREKPIPADATRLAQHLQRLRRLNAKRDKLSKKTIEVLDWAEKELIGPALARHYKLGTHGEVHRALKKKRAETDSQKLVRAAYSAACRDDGYPPRYKALMQKLGQIAKTKKHHGCLPSERTVRYIVEKQLCFPMTPAETGRPFARKSLN